MLGSRSHMARIAVESLGVSVMWTRSTGSLLSSCHALIYKSVHLCEEESSFLPDGCTTWMLHPRLCDFLAAQRHVLPPPWLFVTPAVWKVCVFVLWLLFHDCRFTTRFAGMGNLLKVLTREIENYPHFFLDFESKSGTGVERMEKGWMEKEGGGLMPSVFLFYHQ